MKELLTAILIGICVASCGSLTTTESQLLAIDGKSPMYCSSSDPETLKKNLEIHMNNCYLNRRSVYMNGAMVSDGNMLQLQRKELEEKTQYNFMAGKYYTTAIFIYNKPTLQCMSTLQVFINMKNPSNESRAFKQYKDLAEGKMPKCF